MAIRTSTHEDEAMQDGDEGIEASLTMPEEDDGPAASGARVVLFPLPFKGHLSLMLYLAGALHAMSAPNAAMEDSGHVRDVLALLLADADQPRRACLIFDSTLSAAQNDATALGLPTLVLQTARAASFRSFRYDTYLMLHKKGYLPATGLWCVHVQEAGGRQGQTSSPAAAHVSHGLIVVKGDTNNLRDPHLVRRLHLEVGPVSGGVGSAICGLESTIVTCSACTCCAAPRPPRQAASCCASRLSLQLHLFSNLFCVFISPCVLESCCTHMPTRLCPDRDARFLCPFVFRGCVVLNQRSVVLVTYVLFRQLLLRRWINEVASIWVFGLSFFYLWQRHQHHPLVVRMYHLQRLHRPSFNRRRARSVHPGARVYDAPAYTPRRQKSLPPRLSRRCCLYFWSEDLYVTRSPFWEPLVL